MQKQNNLQYSNTQHTLAGKNVISL